jgi:Tol biopolymer transport system component
MARQRRVLILAQIGLLNVALSCASLFAQTPSVFAPGIISGPAHDSAPAFTPDGKTVYFSRNNAAHSTILVSHLRNGAWTKPEISSFSGEWNDMEPAMSPDGSYLVFVSNRPSHPDGKPIDGFFNGKSWPEKGGNLWRVDRKGQAWHDPVRLSEEVNSSSSTFAPCVVADGSLYFMRPSPATGKFRLFRSQMKAGEFQPPELILAPFDAPYSDVDTAVSPDESFMVFGSSRPPAENMDLFIVFRKDGKWEQPVHLGKKINSPGSEAEARLSADQQTLYFSSDRIVATSFPRSRDAAKADLQRLESWDNGLYNIWYVSISEWLEGRK